VTRCLPFIATLVVKILDFVPTLMEEFVLKIM